MHTHHAHICTHAETHMCMYISCTQCTHIHTQHTSFAYPGVFPGVAEGLWRCGMWRLLTLTYPFWAAPSSISFHYGSITPPWLLPRTWYPKTFAFWTQSLSLQ